MMNKRQLLGVLIGGVLALAGWSQKKKGVWVGVDLFLHSPSTDASDVLLQTAITKRLTDSASTRESAIRVIVVDRVVTLTGTVRSRAMIDAAGQIAQQTELTLNGEAIRPKGSVTNKITLFE